MCVCGCVGVWCLCVSVTEWRRGGQEEAPVLVFSGTSESGVGGSHVSVQACVCVCVCVCVCDGKRSVCVFCAHFVSHRCATTRVLIPILGKITSIFILGKITSIEWSCEVNRERGGGGF